jgi:thiol:disulfide interchange protein DsbD
MSSYKIIFLFLMTLVPGHAFSLSNADLLPPEQAFQISARAISANEIMVSWKIADGYYLYKDKTHIESKTSTIILGEPLFPEGKIKQDEYFGKMEVYRHDLNIPIPLQNSSAESVLKILAQYQGCADIGVCYPPQKSALTINLVPAKTSVNPVNQLFQGFTKFSQGIYQPELLPAEQAFRFSAAVLDAQTLRVNWQIADNYYLYREKIALSLPDSEHTELGSYTIPHGQKYADEAFGAVEIFHNELSFDVPVIRNSIEPQTISLLAKYQGCAELGVCYPPMQKTITLQLPELNNLPTLTRTSKPIQLVSEQDQIAQSLQQDTLWLTLLTFFGFGLLLAFTPCIFPMIPILSGIIVGQGDNVTTRRAFSLSLAFVFASALTYTVFGILAALFGSNLQTTFQQPWIIILFSGIFVLLALSMFGFYNLELPKSLQSRLHNSSEKHRNGSLTGAFIMGALSSLIVGPCVAAPLAGTLIYIGQTGDAVLGGSALFMLGFGMGVPLLLLGASAGKLLPKAGHWLNTTKAIFGVIMLAVAVWMLERILPAPIILFLWAILLIIPAIYLSAIDPLPEHASNWRKLWKGTGLVALIYGALLLIGMSMGNTNPLQPLQGLSVTTRSSTQQDINFQNVSSTQELDRKIKAASARGKWVILDFYADWCISCKEMESYTFSDPRVIQYLSKFVLLQADVTKNTTADKALLERFTLIGPPGIIFFDPNQQEHPGLRVIGYQDADTFLTHLQKTES